MEREPNRKPPSGARNIDSLGSQAAAEPVVSSARSSHIIDLRDQGTDEKPTPAQPTSSYKQAAVAGPRDNRPNPVAKPQVQEREAEADVVTAPGAKRRFWPAFWRFLLLLIVLGGLIAVGVYIYVTYYQA